MPTQLLKSGKLKNKQDTTRQTPNIPGTMDNSLPPSTTTAPLNSPVTGTNEVQPMFDKMVSISKKKNFSSKRIKH